MKLFILFAGLIFVLNNGMCEAGDSVKITLFYESLCPYCVKFVTKQLFETTLTLPNYIKLDLVPYGKAKKELVNGKLQIVCQHGADECYGNKVHACVLEQSKVRSNANLVETLRCLMLTGYSDAAISKCLSLGKFDYSRYARCMINLGNDLAMKYGTRTENNNPKVEFVPLIMINDYFNKTLDGLAAQNLLGTVCGLLSPAPPECTKEYFYNFV